MTSTRSRMIRNCQGGCPTETGLLRPTFSILPTRHIEDHYRTMNKTLIPQNYHWNLGTSLPGNAYGGAMLL